MEGDPPTRQIDRPSDDPLTDMEPLIHDLRDFTNGIEYITATAGALGRDIPPHIALSISTIAAESLLKIKVLHDLWGVLFRLESQRAAKGTLASVTNLKVVGNSGRPSADGHIGSGEQSAANPMSSTI